MYLFFVILFFPVWCSAQIYQWTDAGGLTHFTDQPKPNAKLITLPSSQSYHENVKQQDLSDNIKSRVSPVSYSELKIIEPSENEIISNNSNENILLKINVQPSLRSSDHLQIFVDKQLLEKTQKIDSAFLSNIPRGQHSVEVKIIDDKNNVLISSQPLNFYVQKFHINHQ